ncbi:ribosome assembly RNA-binding protein YhbY [uncultured Gilliamella sp.]|jgi:putative RNA-binding protein, YhbY family|uniref:ribosome assembly RNA-binding protein YhbY n=1 Tax=uncultured Gilliamella sp. TaxID=1193505 RepID=UPI0025FBCA9C|nr:ribosome assembly RNA-binding protein YhbY [uncultured Gilliamella sp.]
MNLSNKQKQYLKSEAHHLKPVVMIGANGFTEGVLAEIENALNFHELIKIKVVAEDRGTKKLICDAIIRETKAEPVQQVGSIFIVYRPSEEQKVTLPK